jgi:hypothetical protein
MVSYSILDLPPNLVVEPEVQVPTGNERDDDRQADAQSEQ